jgi:hypothetical protein
MDYFYCVRSGPNTICALHIKNKTYEVLTKPKSQTVNPT